MLFPSLNINAFLDGIVGSHTIVVEAPVGQMIDYQLLEPIYSCVELVLEHNTSSLIFVELTTSNLRLFVLQLYFQWQQKNTGNMLETIKISNVNIFAFIPWICTQISFLFALQNWALTMLVHEAIQLISTSVSCFHQGLKVHSIDPIFPVKM